MRTGIATMTLDYGQCPAWLFARMTQLMDLETYDKTLSVLENAVSKSNLYLKEKNITIQKISLLHTKMNKLTT